MAGDVLGSTVDINCGGIDLRFPHHDNQLAQSEAKFGCKQWVNYFLHTGHLHIQGLKMSKSLKNFITIRECLNKYTANQLRFLFLKHKFDSPIDIDLVDGHISQMDEAVKLERTFSDFIINCKTILRIQSSKDQTFLNQKWNDSDRKLQDDLKLAQQNFHDALCDSLNTPLCLQILQKIVFSTNSYMVQYLDVKKHLLLSVLEFVSNSLSVFGINANNDYNQIGLTWENSAPAIVEKLVASILDDLCSKRDAIRDAARKKTTGDVIKTLCAHKCK